MDDDLIIGIVVGIGLIIFFILLVSAWSHEIARYDELSKFCDEHNNFCYCSTFECQFKFQSQVICSNGTCSDVILSQDNLEFCDLVREQGDKKLLWEAQCP